MTGEHEHEDHLHGGIEPLTASDPARIGPYVLLGRLGAGGMGRVYLARSEGGRTVAVKVVHPEHVADPQFRARFRREVDAARRVGERYTAPVLHAEPDAESPWIATGYVPGLSLEQVVRGHGPLPAASVLTLADGLLHALKDIHDAGIIHRDLKPSNVMLTVEGPKVIDFGIARAVETSVDSLLTSTGMVIGSPGFMAPEQIRGESAGPKSDVFTLGCVLTYAATGTLPFGNGVSNQHAVMYHIAEAEPDIEQVRDEGLRALIARLLVKSVSERPSVDQLLAERDQEVLAAEEAWLPAGVVGHLARQSARLLDAEAVPMREKGVDRGTVDLRSAAAVPEVAPVRDTAEPKRRRDGRRRPWLVTVPVVVLLAGGGGTLAVLQPFGGDSDGGSHASPSSGTTTPSGPASQPSSDSSPPQGDRSPRASSGEQKGEDGKDGEDGRDAAGSAGGAGAPDSGGTSSEGGSVTGGGSAGSGGSTSTGGTDATGGGSPGSGGSTSGGSSSGGSGSTSGSTTGSGGTSGSAGGSGGGSTVPSSFVSTWKYGDAYNVGQPGTITISGSGVVRLTDFPVNNCPYEAEVTSTANGNSRINVGTARLVGANPGYCHATLDPSYFTLNGSGVQHNVGAAHADGYFYKRA
ncbi:serine/threonine-protein kinase [Streptomyces sp. NPDC005780]|uniref:serine/threonine-protein kinase n=1 Tax=Streptomyces sp. NPDC005780 TaxID=3364730 RepID=UPI00368FCC61